jgi:nicotinamide-nucleotide amidase
LYRKGTLRARLVTPGGVPLGERTALQLTLENLGAQLETEAGALANLLWERHRQGKPHGIAIGEGTVGGVLTQSLAGRAGASRYFRQARFFYDRTAKLNLLGKMPEGGSAVAEQLVGALAQALQREAKADYAVAESGMAGPPDGIRKSLKNGQCWIAVAGPNGSNPGGSGPDGAVHTELVSLNPFLTRKEHMLQFSRRAIMLLKKAVERG